MATVTPVLNNMEGVEKWEVDTASPDKTLTITTKGLNVESLQAKLGKVGYKAARV